MAFLEKIDYYGVGTTYASALVLKGSTENKTASVYEAKNEKGDVVAREVYGETSAPSCSFEVKDDLVLALKLGAIHDHEGRKFCFGSMGIRTQLGSPASVDVGGSQVEDSATTETSTTIDFGYVKLSRFHDAQIPAFGSSATGTFTPAFTLGDGAGTDFFLNDTQIDLAADISPSKVGGVWMRHDIQNGRCTVQGTIVQIGAKEPTLVMAEGWDVTSPLTRDGQDESQPTWKFTATKSFDSVHPAA